MAVYKINSYEKGNVSVRKRTDTDDSSSVVIVAFYKTLNNNSVLIKTSIAEIGAIEKVMIYQRQWKNRRTILMQKYLCGMT